MANFIWSWLPIIVYHTSLLTILLLLFASYTWISIQRSQWSITTIRKLLLFCSQSFELFWLVLSFNYCIHSDSYINHSWVLCVFNCKCFFQLRACTKSLVQVFFSSRFLCLVSKLSLPNLRVFVLFLQLIHPFHESLSTDGHHILEDVLPLCLFILACFWKWNFSGRGRVKIFMLLSFRY